MSADAADDAKPAPPKPRKRAGRQSRIVRLRVVEVVTDYPEDVQRPRVRGDCKDAPRPCPWAGCRHHLAIEFVPPNKGGRGKERLPGLQFNFPNTEIWDMRESCSLDTADRGEHTLDEVGAALAISRQGIEQQESKTFAKLAHRKAAIVLMEQMRERAVQSEERSRSRRK